MENYLSSEFGNLGLSSTAREWRPPGAQQQQQQQQQQSRLFGQNQPSSSQKPAQPKSNEWQSQQGETELNYTVKEFVPGHGWSSQASSVSNAVNDGKNSKDRHKQIYPMTTKTDLKSDIALSISPYLYSFRSKKRSFVHGYFWIEPVAG